ncbi:MAG: phosphoglucosamine mutase [Bacilli bacterium]|nr:phosphoglucosamine mutase [Bacilli bacterium]
MTIGEKIVHLRTVNSISQEALANLLKVSRQSISKWESDEAIPQVDKIRELCNIFKLTADELINEDIVLHKGAKYDLGMQSEDGSKYFGIDGFKGEANVTLTADNAYKIGRFLGWFFSNPKYNHKKPGYRPRVVIGKDTRRSSYMLEYAVAAGLSASGADVELLHVTTTPSVTYITTLDNFDCGIMITASHNPYYDNGIYIINSNGEKIESGVTSLIESYIDGDLSKFELEGNDLAFAKRGNIGRISDYSSGRNRYIGYLISLARYSMKNLRIGLDCANGAAWMIAKSVFDALGAQTFVINNTPSGVNINDASGSTYIEPLVKFVKENSLDVGFAFDGDGDRCIAVDELGHVVDGDKILYLLASRFQAKGILNKNTIVTTSMSNTGLYSALKTLGVNAVQARVGDRYVLEKMNALDLDLGGEQSGNIIMRKYATTGDGLVTALMVVEEMLFKKTTLSSIVTPVKLVPQKLVSIEVNNKLAAFNDETFQEKIKEVENSLSKDGRVVVRQSDTEPKIRIMVESSSLTKCDEEIEKLVTILKRKGYVAE